MAEQSTDDFHINEYERYGEGYKSHVILHDSAVHFFVDGDRSGGELIAKVGASEEEILGVLNVQAQSYDATAGNFQNDSNLQLLWHLVDQSHAPGFLLPPYADGGGACVSEQPVICVVEFYVTAFDRFVWDNPEKAWFPTFTRGSRLASESFLGRSNPAYLTRKVATAFLLMRLLRNSGIQATGPKDCLSERAEMWKTPPQGR